MKKFSKKVCEKNVAVNCQTPEEAKELLSWANRNGFRWFDGCSYENIHRWDLFGKETVYHIWKGTFGNVTSALSEGIDILGYKDALLTYQDEKEKMSTVDEITRDRKMYYDNAYMLHSNIALCWTAFLRQKGLDARLSASDVAMMISFFKKINGVYKHKEDNITDNEEYSRFYREFITGEIDL